MPTVTETKVGKRTTMYSVERIEKKDVKGKGIGEFEDRIVEHHFPWVTGQVRDGKDYGMMKLQKFINRGYTFERPGIMPEITPEDIAGSKPDEVSPAPVENESTEIKVADVSAERTCPDCGKICLNAWGLKTHIRMHNPDGGKRGSKKKK